MQIIGIRLRRLVPPRDSLEDALRASKLALKEGDIVAVSSKVVSIGEGRSVPVGSISKESLMKREADWFLKAPKNSRWRRYFTIKNGIMVGSAGIDESNGDAHHILYPAHPLESAKRLRRWLMKEYGVKKLGLIITDSTSIPLRRGAVGCALAWDGFDPLRDYRGTPDLFGRKFDIEMANLADSLAAAAVLVMGEGTEQTPVAAIRAAPGIVFKNRAKHADQLAIEPEDDLFAPFLLHKSFRWKKKRER